MNRERWAFALLALSGAALAVAAVNWRTLTTRETITLDKGAPLSLPAGFRVCSDGHVPAVLNPQRKTFVAGECLRVFKGGFE